VALPLHGIKAGLKFLQDIMAEFSTNQIPLNTMVHMETIKLTPTNYLLWCRQLVLLFESQDLMVYLDESFLVLSV
jgi:hypothetical protein